MKQAAVVGAGTMGNGIAHVFAQHGWQVSLIDVAQSALDRGTAAIRGNLDRQVKKGTLTAPDADEVMGRITTHLSLDAATGAEVVVEAASERPDIKFGLFEQLDRLASPAAILATNTSSISITEIAARTRRPGQVIGMHFMNPVPVMQLVEIIRGHATTDATTAWTVETARALGKIPVEVNDYPGFVSNRVLMPMINEAIFCVMEGVATPEVDRHRDEARHGPPDGAVGPGRLHRARRVPRHPRGAAPRPGRRQVPGLPAPPPHGGRGLPRPEERPRLLRVRQVTTPTAGRIFRAGASTDISQ